MPSSQGGSGAFVDDLGLALRLNNPPPANMSSPMAATSDHGAQNMIHFAELSTRYDELLARYEGNYRDEIDRLARDNIALRNYVAQLESEVIRLGEFDEEKWIPFKFDPPDEDNFYSSSSDEDDSEDGISDTWEAGDVQDKEEGEICPDDEDFVDAEIPQSDDNNPRSPERNGTVNDKQSIGCSHSSNNVQSPTVRIQEVRETRGEKAADNEFLKDLDLLSSGAGININPPTRSANAPNIPIGSFNGLVSNGCFGPFNSPYVFAASDPCFEAGGSIGKRRRVINKKTQQHRSQPWSLNFAEPQIDLNKSSTAHSSDTTLNEDTSMGLEVRKTIEIGKQLGFEIEEGDPVLLDVMEKKGEDIVIQ
ncbi:hypothetical protein L1887_11144 [Cichorium endivia]|nr:hypothetical protein L1887_11144 [Cichorium endivia]